jgi:murein DD-endopeptidase MepM/ murein hydrolase activator NlpD
MIVLLLCLSGCAVPIRRSREAPLPPVADMPAPGTFVPPLPGARVISSFGMRHHEFHQGIDLKKSEAGGEPVLAARAGIVEAAERYFGYGRMVLIGHEDGCRTRYAHLRTILVRQGQKVASGEEIGTVGSTGRATTAHLHFEIITRSNCPIDPSPYLKDQKIRKVL